MWSGINPLRGPNGQRGISSIVVAVGLLVFIGMTVLAVDLSFLYVARNEIQNAADAGALAGARWLYLNDGTLVNEIANKIAYDAATANRSRQLPVGVNWTSGNAGDVQRGHWSFATRTFTANPSTAIPDLWNKTTAELDADPNFINAVRVVARSQAIPVATVDIGCHSAVVLAKPRAPAHGGGTIIIGGKHGDQEEGGQEGRQEG